MHGNAWLGYNALTHADVCVTSQALSDLVCEASARVVVQGLADDADDIQMTVALLGAGPAVARGLLARLESPEVE